MQKPNRIGHASDLVGKAPSRVYTIRNEIFLGGAVKELAKHHIGVLVVTYPAGGLKSIVSERDVFRDLA